MYANVKIRPVETIPGRGRGEGRERRIGEGRERRMVERVNSSMIYLVYCKNFCKHYNVLPPV
jgi:hypothetical protein